VKPEIPFTEYAREATRETFILVEPIAAKIEEDKIDDAKEMLARLTLWLLARVEEEDLEPWKARNAFFLLNVYLIDNYPGEIIGEEAHELIYEGTLLHEYGQEMGPDIELMRNLANRLLGDNNI
jgi:hypothetical protein